MFELHLFNETRHSYRPDFNERRASSRENQHFEYAKTKAQISFAVTAKLISAFIFAARIVQLLFYLYPKFEASSVLLWLYSSGCVEPVRKPRRPGFSRRGSNEIRLIVAHDCIFYASYSKCRAKSRPMPL